MQTTAMRRLATAVAVVALVASCLGPTLTPSPSAVTATPTLGPTAGPTLEPTPGATPLPTFPLAVVTGLTNLKSAITLTELAALAARDELVVPCGIEITAPALPAGTRPCRRADRIGSLIEADQALVALLPPGLVVPATRVLPIDGDGPFGLFGADIFGDPAARALPYPITGWASPNPSGAAAGSELPAEWLAYDASKVWTISSVGGSCPDAAAGYEATVLGKGWDWVFDGGTATYKGKPFLNPNPPPGISSYPIVSPIDSGNPGTVARLVSGADLTIADVECPIVDAADWTPNYLGQVLVFSISSDVLPLWRDKLGFDLLYMAANHNSDKGAPGIRSSLRLLDEVGIQHTGLGLDINGALEPAYVERAGIKIAFVAWNDVPGVTRATADRPGVPWLTRENVIESVGRARASGAQIVICDPQWWGGAEYHGDLWAGQREQLGWFDAAGCDHVIGAGTHLAGPMVLRDGPTAGNGAGASLVMASEGNVMFGQGWWQDTQEGVFMSLSFSGTRLVNVHLYPYVMIRTSRASLTDPEGDGHYVLERVWANSEVDYLP